MSQCTIKFLGNVQQCRTEAEISCVMADGSPKEVAIVFETASGWQIDIDDEAAANELGNALAEAVKQAKASLLHYVNRLGETPPKD